MIRGTSSKPLPYVLEEDRGNPIDDQTIFWIKPKSGQDANETMRRYAACGRDGRKGYRDLNTQKLNSADIEEFLAIVTKVENFCFSIEYKEAYWKKTEAGDYEEQPSRGDSVRFLTDVCRNLSADHLIEIIETANNISKLRESEKKSSDS